MDPSKVTQIYSIVNSILREATGDENISVNNTGEFVAVAQRSLARNYDVFSNSISQVLSKTIWSVRPYSRKFKDLMVDTQKFGNIVRKLTPCDGNFSIDAAYSADGSGITDGASVDMYKIAKPKFLETVFTGRSGYNKYYTMPRDQMNMAMRGPEELAQYFSTVATSIKNEIEKAHEEMSRATLVSTMASASERSNSRVKLITEYMTATGESDITLQSILKNSELLKRFSAYVIAMLNRYKQLFSERTALFQTEIDGFPIYRFTPESKLRVYVLSYYEQIFRSMVAANTYHDKLLEVPKYETVTYWQAINNEEQISVNQGNLQNDGTVGAAKDITITTPILAVMMDEDACGVTITNYEMSSTPYNSAGRYSNIWYSFEDRYWRDDTEKCVIFTLD